MGKKWELARALQVGESYTDGQGFINQRHSRRMEGAESATEAAFVDGPNLVEQNDGIRLEATFRRFDKHLGRVEFRVVFGRDRRDDREIAESVADVVLNDDCGAGLGDLYPFGRIKADNIHVAPFRDYRRASRCHTSSASGSHSAASSRSRWARLM